MSDDLVYEAATRLFGDLSTEAAINAAEAGTWPAALWEAVVEAGFPDALIGEEPFGFDGFPNGAAILRAAGQHAVPLPLAETMLARWWLAGAGLPAPDGPLTLAPLERGDAIAITPGHGGCRVEGAAGYVPWARDAAGIVALGEGYVALLPRDRVEIRPEASYAGEPRDQLGVALAVDDAAAAPVPTAFNADLAPALGALCRAAQLAGAMETVLDLTTQYANDRVQFGRPIGKFQAIQQQMALLAEQVAASRAAADAAWRAVAMRGPAARFAIASAKIRTGEAAGRVADIAHQVHGAIGFTFEHRLHHLTRRMWSWRDECGTESDWSLELGRLVAAGGPDALWPSIVSE